MRLPIKIDVTDKCQRIIAKAETTVSWTGGSLWEAGISNVFVGISIGRGEGKNNSEFGSVFLQARKASSYTKQNKTKSEWQR